MSIAERLKDMRNNTGLTQEEFAELFGIPLRSYQNWEEGHRDPPSYVIDLIEYVYHTKF